MNLPFYFRLGSFQLHAHWLFETLAYATGFWLYRRQRQDWGDTLSDGDRWWVITAAATGAAIGSKLLYWFEDPRLTLAHWADPAFLMAGKTIVGGLIGGLFAVEWIKPRIAVRQPTGDLFALPLCIGIAIGRIGCFLEGLPDHTFGKETALPWGVNFGDGILRHPTQLYETTFMLFLAIGLYRLQSRQLAPGRLFKLFMISYVTFRLLVDFLKPDIRLAGLSSIQWCCLAILWIYRSDLVTWLGFPRAPVLTSRRAHFRQNEGAADRA